MAGYACVVIYELMSGIAGCTFSRLDRKWKSTTATLEARTSTSRQLWRVHHSWLCICQSQPPQHQFMNSVILGIESAAGQDTCETETVYTRPVPHSNGNAVQAPAGMTYVQSLNPRRPSFHVRLLLNQMPTRCRRMQQKRSHPHSTGPARPKPIPPFQNPLARRPSHAPPQRAGFPARTLWLTDRFSPSLSQLPPLPTVSAHALPLLPPSCFFPRVKY